MPSSSGPRAALCVAASFLTLTLFAALAGTAGAAFPGDNGKIAFDSTRDSFFEGPVAGAARQGFLILREVYVADPDGGNPTRLTNGLTDFECNAAPAWS